MKANARRWCGTPLRLAVVVVAAMVIACGQQPAVEEDNVSLSGAAITADHVIPTGQACTPTGKHLEHGSAGVACATCHQCPGTVSFDPNLAGPNAAFDATTKNCSNLQCHGVPSGTFEYTTWDWGSDSAVIVQVPYGGTSGSSRANWYAAPGTGDGCSSCHGYPTTYNGVAYPWHAGNHGLTVPNGNNCTLCHPDASGAYVFGGPPSYVPTSGGLISSCPPGQYCSAPGVITNPSRHHDGKLDVTPNWQSNCFPCH